MKKLLLLVVAMTIFLLQTGTAPGAMILDTGLSWLATDPYYGQYWTGAYTLSCDQGFAGKFTTTQAWNVGAMQGYITTITPGDVDVIIYAYDGPGTTPEGSPLINKTFTSQAAGFTGWQGTTGFAGTLAAGDYWIAFQVHADSTFFGGIGDSEEPLNRLDPEAYTSNGVWLLASVYNINGKPLYLEARIAEAEVVPLPGAVWLLGSGLAGLIGLKRKSLR